MAFTFVLKIGSIKGESVVGGAKEPPIDVLEWSFGLTQSASAHTAQGGSSGTADVRDLTIKKYLDAASPVLLQECFNGTNQAPATLTCYKSSGKELLPYWKMSMEGTVFISSVNTGQPEPNDRLSETVTLNFSKATFEYTSQTANQGKGLSTNGVMTIAEKVTVG
jgi:type VI secretion system secreted protein Hcp